VHIAPMCRSCYGTFRLGSVTGCPAAHASFILNPLLTLDSTCLAVFLLPNHLVTLHLLPRLNSLVALFSFVVPLFSPETHQQKMLSKLLIVFVLATVASANCLHGTSFMPRAAGTIPVSPFSYTGEFGPLNWAGLDPANSACRKSTTQSPIVLDQTIPMAQSVPQITIDAVKEAEFENLGSTLETIVNGTTVFEGTTYLLKQFHFHTPSEHRINEEHFPLEMHMVHQSVRCISLPSSTRLRANQ
jgi:hypothetical protein